MVASTPVSSASRASALSASGSGSWSNPYFSGLSSGSSGSSYNALFKQLQDIQAKNNAWSAEQAQKQMDFQRSSAREAMQFNSDQADISRKWQEYMSNTAHQREIKDLQAAGLNPVLSAMGGSGAPVTSGATASGYASQGAMGETDTSLSGALVSLFSSALSAQTSLANQAVSAQTNLAVADKYTAMSKLVAELQSDTSLSVAHIQSMASAYAANTHADATKVAASINAAAQKYGYDLNAMTQKQIAAFNASVNSDLQQAGFQHDFDIREAYPNNAWQFFSSLLGQTFGDSGFSGTISSAMDAFNSFFDNLTTGKNHYTSSSGGTFNKSGTRYYPSNG